jgi:hypothetical protein
MMTTQSLVQAWLEHGQDRVTARRGIQQNPLSDERPVPAGALGLIQDYADDLLWVDFGEPYGTIAVDPNELARGWRHV